MSAAGMCSSHALAEPRSSSAVDHEPWKPTRCANVKRYQLSMAQLRDLCRAVGIVFSGRVTKPYLFELVCQHFGLSTSGGVETSADTS